VLEACRLVAVLLQGRLRSLQEAVEKLVGAQSSVDRRAAVERRLSLALAAARDHRAR
jgi:hypothetical protein